MRIELRASLSEKEYSVSNKGRVKISKATPKLDKCQKWSSSSSNCKAKSEREKIRAFSFYCNRHVLINVINSCPFMKSFDDFNANKAESLSLFVIKLLIKYDSIMSC